MIDNSVKIIKHKVGLLNLAEELGNVSKACKVMGLSRDTFYRYKSAVDEGGVEALFDQSRRKPNVKNRVDESIEEAVRAYAIEYLHMANNAPVMNYVNKVFLFLEVEHEVFGCAIN